LLALVVVLSLVLECLTRDDDEGEDKDEFGCRPRLPCGF